MVAARAVELIREGDWRDARDRDNLQAAIESRGLWGGEVILLAESFGQAHVVRSLGFVSALESGHSIMVNVAPSNGNLNGGHEVVLTKALEYGGETFLTVEDSYQGPLRRLFFTCDEFDTILQERGVVFQPDAGTTPRLLQGGNDH